ncbi:hypothetical protein PTE30175_04672 [Pandoraea terrae]|uniref:LysR family transcriptional regulator n=1 Tax=Pandoraea terrae TaxID=1537710 RepID=A0A5E4YV83_9BURK|nr:hypothetical protein PTE30175_04672 [Pandoraea terrae]
MPARASSAPLPAAYIGDQEGRALNWWLEQLRQPRLAQRLVDGLDEFTR